MSFSLGSAAPTKRARKALAAIERAVENDRALGRQAADLLESVVVLLNEKRDPSTMSAAEQAEWEALGARFDDRAASARTRLRSRRRES